MAAIFKTFRSTDSPWSPRNWISTLRLLVDNNTGAPIGLENPNAGGPDAIWTPVRLTAAQIAMPTAAILADVNSTYQLNVAPYTRYVSTGTILQEMTPGGADGTNLPGAVTNTIPPGSALQIIGVGSYFTIPGPFTVQSVNGVSVQGKMTIT